MPFSADAAKPPLHDQITEMQRKIQLLEGNRTAYYESSQAAIRKNRDTIAELRQENKRLYRKLAEANAGDEHIIKGAFHNRGLEKDAYRNMSVKVRSLGKTTEEFSFPCLFARRPRLDRRVLSKIERLNSLKHTTKTYQQRLDELSMEYRRMNCCNMRSHEGEPSGHEWL